MKQIPNISFTRQEIEEIYRHNFVNFGEESRICRSNKPNALYKVFQYGFDIAENEAKIRNKENKIIAIYNKQLEHSVNIISTIYCDGKLVGYEMSYDEEDEAFDTVQLHISEKIYYLYQVKEILKYYETQNVIYGDVKSDNILINKKTQKCKFCDIDNIKIAAYCIDLFPEALSNYITNGGRLDNKVHAYMHNLLTLYELNDKKDNYTQILNKILIETFPDYITQEGRKILESMLEPASFTGEYVIEYVKK